jgi:uncharacterized protein YyaL (SSP411 family)
VSILTVAVAAAIFASGCSGTSDEQQLLKKYFDASRMRDNATLANIAAVSFRPQEEGSVQSFSVVSVTEDPPRQLRIQELNKAFEAVRQADEEFTKTKREYQDKNIDAIDRVLKAERENKPLSGRDATVQKEWTTWREETAANAKKVSDARQALNAERSVAELSAYDARDPINILDYEGSLHSKQVAISARVRTPDNQTADKEIVVTLQRAELKGKGGELRNGRWVITGIK